MKNNKHHGGDLGWAIDHFDIEQNDWIDLSTGINQTPYPFEIKEGFDVNSLPPKALYDRCLNATASYYDANLNASNTLLTPGSQFIISQLPHLFEPASIAILYPTYGEHAPSWEEAGHKVKLVSDLEAARNAATRFVLLVNPNNPDGKLFEKDELLELAKYQASKDGYLIIDEAFIDIAPEESLSEYTGQDGLIILRSFGKFFGLAGVRLGTLLAPADIIGKLQRRLGPWAVSSITLAIASQAYQDQSWIKDQLSVLQQSADKMDQVFINADCKLVGGTILYRLYEIDDAPALFEHMGQNGLYLRHFEYNQKWLRVGVPSLHNDELWHRVEKTLKQFYS